MITELTDIAALGFHLGADDVPRVAMRYAGCDLLVVDEQRETWHLWTTHEDAEIGLTGKMNYGIVVAIMTNAVGFVATESQGGEFRG